MDEQPGEYELAPLPGRWPARLCFTCQDPQSTVSTPGPNGNAASHTRLTASVAIVVYFVLCLPVVEEASFFAPTKYRATVRTNGFAFSGTG